MSSSSVRLSNNVTSIPSTLNIVAYSTPMMPAPRIALEPLDAIAQQLRANDLALALHHAVGADEQVLDPDLGLGTVGGAVEHALAQPGQVDHRLAPGLAGEGGGVEG